MCRLPISGRHRGSYFSFEGHEVGRIGEDTETFPRSGQGGDLQRDQQGGRPKEKNYPVVEESTVRTLEEEVD